MQEDISGYLFENADPCHSHSYLLPKLKEIIRTLSFARGTKIFELGCGNGAMANALADMGFDVTGVDPSKQGISQANINYPHIKLFAGSAYENLTERFGLFPLVISLEVVEHVYAPRKYANTIWNMLSVNGIVIISTPYHGYCKNLALALTGKLEKHFSPLWDNGHIKFWSEKSLRALLTETGFEIVAFERVGRIPILAKSMIFIARKKAL